VKTQLPHGVGKMRHPRRRPWRGQEVDHRRVILREEPATLSELSAQPQTRFRPPVTAARWSRRHETSRWQVTERDTNPDAVCQRSPAPLRQRQREPSMPEIGGRAETSLMIRPRVRKAMPMTFWTP
jgi:hypothetical protein